jgi:hypothetical protein
MNDVQLLTEKYQEVQENLVFNQLLQEQNEQLKALVDKFKTAKETGNKQEMDILIPQIVSVIAEMFKPEAEEAVKMFEGDTVKTTRGNYGRYMAFLSNLKGLYQAGMVKALQNAGAGRGLSDALAVIRGPY